MPQQRVYTKDIILILAGSFFYIGCSMLINPLITGFAKSLGSSTFMAGLMAGSMNITSLILRPIAGNLADRLPKFRLSLTGASFLLISTIGYIFSNSAALLFAFRVLNGIGYVCCTVSMSTWMAGLLPHNKIGSGMGIYGLMNALAMAIAPALGITLYQHFGYHVALTAAAVFSLAMLILIQFVGDHGNPKPRPKLSEDKAPHLQIFQPKVMPVSIILTLFSLPYFATQAYIVSYAAEKHAAIVVSLFFPIYAIILLVMRLSLKRLFDTVAFGRFLKVGLISTVVGLLALTDLHNNWIMVLAALGIAGGYGLMYSVCQGTALLLVPENEQGIANSTFYIGIDLGMALGPILGGVIRSILPISWFYPVMLITVPLIYLVYFPYRQSLNLGRPCRG